MIALLTGVFMSFWRRMFGSDGWNKPVIKNRFVQHVIGFVCVVIALIVSDYHWAQASCAALVLQFLFWAPSHGPAFDMSRDGSPDKKMLERYDNYFWNSLCEFLVPKTEWYNFGYDFLWMLFRYGLPSAVVSIILLSPYFAFSGVLTAFVYAICWSLKDIGIIKKSPTAVAEWIVGFIVGFLIVS